MAVTGFVLGIIGLAMPAIAFLIPIGLGLAAFVVRLIARRRAKRPAMGRKTMATWAVVLGILAFATGIWGAARVDSAVNDLNRSLSTHCINHSNASDCQ